MHNSLKKLYLMFLIFGITRNQGTNKTYSQVVFWAKIYFTLLLPFLIALELVGSIYRVIRDQDLEDAVNSSQTILTVYQETSEFEYRSSLTVFERIFEKAILKKKHGARHDLATSLVMPNKILNLFFIYENRLFVLRLENQNEFIEAGYQQYLKERR